MPLRPATPASPLFTRPAPLTTGRQAPGMRPLWLMVLASLWIATLCNVALWRELFRLPGLSGGQAFIQLDVDGNGVSDMSIMVTATAVLQATDFIL